MNKNKVIIELIETLVNYKKFEEINSGIIAKINYQDASDSKNYLRYYVNSKEIKSVNPGLIFMSKKQDYFKSHQEMVKFFIENVFNKQINLDTHKSFSKYKISFKELEAKKIIAFNELLNNSLNEKGLISRPKI